MQGIAAAVPRQKISAMGASQQKQKLFWQTSHQSFLVCVPTPTEYHWQPPCASWTWDRSSQYRTCFPRRVPTRATQDKFYQESWICHSFRIYFPAPKRHGTPCPPAFFPTAMDEIDFNHQLDLRAMDQAREKQHIKYQQRASAKAVPPQGHSANLASQTLCEWHAF